LKIGSAEKRTLQTIQEEKMSLKIQLLENPFNSITKSHRSIDLKKWELGLMSHTIARTLVSSKEFLTSKEVMLEQLQWVEVSNASKLISLLQKNHSFWSEKLIRQVELL
jgi:hypothetical protein